MPKKIVRIGKAELLTHGTDAEIVAYIYKKLTEGGLDPGRLIHIADKSEESYIQYEQMVDDPPKIERIREKGWYL